ncbi:laccase-12-like [Senna tora]|uniref:Laccase-12-like n=1 Tax=Senna tora TaxID=362788 RepID=A0A834XGD9_9FABA|nr:laccase-12-like [Senna tora]
MATMQPGHGGNFSASSRVLARMQNGEWWDANPIDVVREATRTGATPNVSNAYTINGQLGDFYKCSFKSDIGANTMIEALEEVKGARKMNSSPPFDFLKICVIVNFKSLKPEKTADKIAMNITTERGKTLQDAYGDVLHGLESNINRASVVQKATTACTRK